MAQATTSDPLSESSAELRKRVFTLALPAVSEQVLNTLVGLADIFLVGNLSLAATEALGYGRVEAVAGIGLGNQMGWLMMVLFMATGIGGTALIARAVGAQDEENKRRFLRTAILIAIGVGILATVLVILFAETFLWALGAPPEVFPRSLEYLAVLSLGMVPTSLLLVGTACLRGAGDTRTPLYIMLGVNILNVFLTWLLVNGEWGLPVLGVVGAAIGTVVARAGGGIAVLGLLWWGRSGLKLDLDLRPDLEVMRRLVKIAAPTAGEMLVFHGALLIFTGFVTGLGTIAYAAHIATINVESLSFLPGLGYAAAAGALVGQGLGAKSPELAERSAYEALWQGMAMMAAVGLVMIIFPDVLLGFFVNDPAAVAIGATPLIAAGIVQPSLAVNFILNGALRGAGDTRWPLYSRILGTWFVRLPVAIVCVGFLDAGLNGIWLAMCADFSIQALLAFWRFSSGRWKTVEV